MKQKANNIIFSKDVQTAWNQITCSNKQTKKSCMSDTLKKKVQKCKEEPEIAVCVHACTYALCSTCHWYYSTRQLNLFLAWRYNLGILKGAQGPPAFMLECLVKNLVLQGSAKKKKSLVHLLYVVIGPSKSLGTISIAYIPGKHHHT